MLISLSEKFIFLSNPKCASSTIRVLLGKYAQISNYSLIKGAEGKSKEYLNKHRLNVLHLTAHELRDAFKNLNSLHIWDNVYKFSTIRNPFHRLVSWYFFLEPDKNFKTIIDEEVGDYDENSRYHHHFNDFIDYFANQNNGDRLPPNYETSFTNWETGELLLDDIFKLEDIDTLLPSKLKENTGIDLPSPLPNVMPDFKAPTRSRHVKFKGNPYDLYNDESRKIAEEIYATDIEKFNYQFGQ
jgi:hypothetical protein